MKVRRSPGFGAGERRSWGIRQPVPRAAAELHLGRSPAKNCRSLANSRPSDRRASEKRLGRLLLVHRQHAAVELTGVQHLERFAVGERLVLREVALYEVEASV